MAALLLLRRVTATSSKSAFILRHYGAANRRFLSNDVAEDAPVRQKVRADFPTFTLDAFALRQFDDPAYAGTIVKYDKDVFEAKINEFFEAGECDLVDGYAPFCKHLFVPNFINARIPTVPITNKSVHLLQSGYISRVPEELPVHSVTPETAKYLDIVLYSREQVRLENAAMGKPIDSTDSPWRIVSIKAQVVDYELPMEPMAVLRNALGTDAGGSGVALDKDKYLKSVEYWSQHAHIKYH
ncbi:hypothetical protein DYB25_005961 [Aphanomyces astaci]|uniref:Uncharacterized protein n=1 Tax=Aphanomyces astaci TaxID=112090 RepID=A0A397D5A4_APHAT|nr:hypothetical protein DYB25_005961 [Aphanomyces astaci]RHY48047.1 hypothetical protein DYB34_009928 [Aphanomyces astaci]RHY55843.1 hypothetical protein DYB30_009873 [Aphanomyces astaci]RHZ24930.1 hypothetical protein DYB31_010509 [Aphanomyces astaci]